MAGFLAFDDGLGSDISPQVLPFAVFDNHETSHKLFIDKKVLRLYNIFML